jgi:hypothetical protein
VHHWHRRDLEHPRIRRDGNQRRWHCQQIHYDSDKPDGTRCRLRNVDKMKALGSSVSTGLRGGIVKAYGDFKEQANRQ